MQDPPAFAPLTARLIRRAAPAAPDVAVSPSRRSEWRADARLFLFAWACGFLFFLVFLA